MRRRKPSGRKGRGSRKEHNGKHHDRHPRTYSQPKVLPQLQSAELFPPLVPTASPKPATVEVKYSKEEICEIVKEVKDLSCPEIASEGVREIVRAAARREA